MENKKFNFYILFDYVYYTIAYQYYKWYSEEINEFSGIIMLSLIQQLNIIVIFKILKINLLTLIFNNSLYFDLVGYFLFVIINSIRYKKIITYNELHKRWGNDDKKTNFIKKALVLLYIILTIVGLIISAQWQ